MKKFNAYNFTLVVVFLATLLIGATTAAGSKATDPAPKSERYALDTVVVQIEPEMDLVCCVDDNDNFWEFNGIEDWRPGDTCLLLMDDKGTENIYDDEIVNMRYSAWELSK